MIGVSQVTGNKGRRETVGGKKAATAPRGTKRKGLKRAGQGTLAG